MASDVLQELLERVVRIETKIDGYNNLRDKLDTTYMMTNQNTEDIKEMKDNQKWLWRTIAGAVIVLLIGAMVTINI